MANQYDFSGWATRNDLLCGDGRTIRKNAFKDNDGCTVPLIWNHDHTNPDAVLGHALLQNRDDGVYAYCTFNDTASGQNAKKLVQNGDVRSLSIWANKLKHIGNDVVHGMIRELSLVLAGANPGASIDWVLEHGDDGDESIIANYDENALVIYHSDEYSDDEDDEETLSHANEDDEENDESEDEEETVADIIATLNEKQMTVFQSMIGRALEFGDEEDDEDDEDDEVEHSDEDNDDIKHSEGGDDFMKTNVFDKEDVKKNTLSHSDQEAIIARAKSSGIGSLKDAIRAYVEENKETLAHGLDLGDTETLELLLPDFKNLNPGAPEILRQDQSWVMKVINKIHKSPYSRIRTRKADARVAELKAKGYQKKGDEKTNGNHIKLLTRTTDPQTIYIKDELHRDDIIDITDFDVIAYTWSLMKDTLYETLALAALVGDGREDGDPDKIQESHVRSIWNDEELYTIHKDVDLAAAKAELQGSNTSANFSENYIYAEAMIMAALYAREQYKGTGTPDYYCAPHSINVMLLARDLNGRRIYDSKADLAKALNVNDIIEIEQLEGRTRTDSKGNTKKLHGIFVNLADYQFGSTKGGEVTKFSDFDIDFNKEKYLMEARLSGALTKPFAAIALEEPVEAAAG